MRSLFLSILIISVSTNFAQITFQENYGTTNEDVAYAVQQTSDGGYIIAGNNQWSQYQDIYLVKTDEWGDTLWTRQYPRAWSESARAILETSDGFLAAGYAVTSLGPSRTDVYLLKTNSLGDTMWTKTIGGLWNEQAFDIKATHDGGYIICGHADDNTGQVYFYLVKTNSMGETSWTKKYGITTEEWAYAKSVQQTSDDGYILTGYVDDYTVGTGTGYIYLVKTDPLGSVEWTESYDWSGSEVAYSIEVIPDGYVLVGRTNSMGAGSTDIFMMKTDVLGTPVWTKTYGDSAGETAYAVEKTIDGGFVVSGFTYSSGAGSSDFYLIKTNSNGDTSWTRTFGGTHREEAYDVKQAADGGYVLAGYSYSYSVGGADFYCVKTDGNGLVPIRTQKDHAIIQDYRLYQNYPNPFNPSTTIELYLPMSCEVTLKIYNILGEEITTLLSASLLPGSYQYLWSPPAGISSGIYLYRLQTRNYIEMKKMVLMR